MRLRYKCLVLDHDDTAVMSTPAVHYPSFMEALKHLRPGLKMSRTEYNRLNYDPGFEKMCCNVLGFTREEMAWQLRHWQDYVETRVPPFYPGMDEVIRRQKAAGGLLCVVSQSYARFVERDYASAGLPLPDRVLGWELGSEKQKPHPDPLLMLMREFGLKPADILMVDDLKPGFDMARAAGCDCAAALWAYTDDPDMQRLVLAGCPEAVPLYTVNDLAAYQFPEENP